MEAAERQLREAQRQMQLRAASATEMSAAQREAREPLPPPFSQTSQPETRAPRPEADLEEVDGVGALERVRREEVSSRVQAEALRRRGLMVYLLVYVLYDFTKRGGGRLALPFFVGSGGRPPPGSQLWVSSET